MLLLVAPRIAPVMMYRWRARNRASRALRRATRYVRRVNLVTVGPYVVAGAQQEVAFTVEHAFFIECPTHDLLPLEDRQ